MPNDISLQTTDASHARIETLALELFEGCQVGLTALDEHHHPEAVARMNAYSVGLGRGIEIEDLRHHPDFDAKSEIRFFANRLIRGRDGNLTHTFFVCGECPRKMTVRELQNLDLLGALAQDLLSAAPIDRAPNETNKMAVTLDFKPIFHGSREPMCLLSYPEMKFAEVNEAAEVMIGRPAAALLGTRFGELTDGYATGVFPKLLNQLEAQGRSGPSQLTFRILSEERVVVMSGQVLESEGTTYALLIGQDITSHVGHLAREQQRAKELEAAKVQAEAANRAKNSFLARMSHELRTPLNSILGFTMLLAAESEATESQQQTLSHIESSGNYLLDMINDILEMSKIESGESDLKLKPIALRAMVDELMHTFQQRAATKSLSFGLNYEELLPFWVISDRSKLRQILSNLLSNAIKFTETGSVDISISSKPDGKLHFEVRDTGVGIPTSALGRLFEPFGETHTDIHPEEGAGLGLALSKNFVEQLGGQLTIDSTSGVGTTVTFEIASREAESVVKDQAITVENVRGVHGQRRPKILVVDDHPVNRRVLNALCKKVGFEVDEAENGLEAVNRINEESRPDLVLMDIRMPVMDGLEATRAIRSLGGELAHIGVFALTGNAYDEDRQTALDAGCNAFLSKPIDMDELLQRIAVNLDIVYELENQD